VARPTHIVLSLLLCCALGAACAQGSPDAGAAARRAFYAWRTTFAPSPAERAALASLHADRLYLRVCDVDLEGGAPVPLGRVMIAGPLPAGVDVVPVVFLRDEVWRAVGSAGAPALAERTYAEVRSLANRSAFEFRELQLDCDWTDSTRAAYFDFLRALDALARPDGRTLSATVRLHQVKYRERTGVPPVGRGMLSQIELAWGEGQLLVADVLEDIAVRMRDAAKPLDAKVAAGTAAPADKERLAFLRDKEQNASRLAGALSLVGMQHLWAGASLAQTVIEERPDNYVGYRLAADFYRLRGEWKIFDELVAKIEKLNPDSNGLVFLRGVAALNRDGNSEAARTLFHKALEKDPKFVRAQVYNYLASPFVSDAFDELVQLKALNPNHQLVVWALPAIAEAYEAGVLVRKPKAAPVVPAAPVAN
jgi:hypothetical protein